MTKSHTIVAAAVATALIGFATAASAAPAGGMTAAGVALKDAAQPAAENARWTCWWSRGHRRCGWVRSHNLRRFVAPRRRVHRWSRWH